MSSSTGCIDNASIRSNVDTLVFALDKDLLFVLDEVDAGDDNKGSENISRHVSASPRLLVEDNGGR